MLDAAPVTDDQVACAPYAPKAEATAPSRQHRLAEVPRGTQVTLAAKPLWPVPVRTGERAALGRAANGASETR